DLMFPLGPFILRCRAEIVGLTATLAVVIGVAAIGFLLVPAELAYPQEDAGIWVPLYAWNRRIVLTYNLVPSLHVALSVVTLSAYGVRRGQIGKMMFAAWGAAIA